MKRVITNQYAIHYRQANQNYKNKFDFEIYRIEHYTNSRGEEDYCYFIDGEEIIGDISEKDFESLEGKIEGSSCWRGVWEGRLYFTDEEYWGSDLMELAKLYEDTIVPLLRKEVQLLKGEVLEE